MMPVPDDRRPALQPPQFGLRSMMWAVACLGVFFGLFVYFGLHVTLILVVFALGVLAHVTGNALGMRLRQNGDTPLDDQGQLGATRPIRPPSADDFAPATRLGHRVPLGRTNLLLTAAGMMLFGVVAATCFLVWMQEPNWASVVVGGLAAAVLGGIWTFTAVSFIQVLGGAAWQASREQSRR